MLRNSAARTSRKLSDNGMANQSSFDSEQKGGDGGLVALLVVGSLLMVVILGCQLYKLTQRWVNRARSAKVLDEIEMEFVNDVDIDEELLRR